MATTPNFQNAEFKPKSFWKRPEGVTGTIFLIALLAGAGLLVFTFLPQILLALQNTLYLALTLVGLGALLYMILDPKMRNLVWYMYKSVMRGITSVFVQIDPIGILKSYVESLQDNLKKMRTQIGKLRGQMRQLQTLVETNNKEIDQNMKLASAARQKGMESQVVLSSRKAARLQESNAKYQELLQKMEVLYRILTKMEQNSEILIEDTASQVALKEQERKAIRASHGAMRSAMSIMSGDPDQRAMFDMAMENIAEDVANKVGEMERFMEMSANFMQSVDLQQGIYQEEGLNMLEKWEKESTLMLLDSGNRKASDDTLDLNSRTAEPEKRTQSGSSSYDSMFN
jgi:phage shock protein A